MSASYNVHYACIRMQRNLDLLPDWLRKWRLTVNAKKTQAIIFTRSQAQLTKLKLEDTELDWQKTAKYLGIHLDKRLTMKTQVKHAVAMSRVARKLLRPVLSSDIPLTTKLTIYKLYIRSILTYATPAWFALASATNKKLMQSQQSAALREAVGAPRYVRNSTIARDLRVESIRDFVERLTENIFSRTDASSWPHLKGIAPLHARPPDSKPYQREMLKQM